MTGATFKCASVLTGSLELNREAGDVPRPGDLSGGCTASKELLLPPLTRGSQVSPQEAKRDCCCVPRSPYLAHLCTLTV